LEYIGEALFGAHMCMVKMVETLAETFGWVPCNPIPELSKDFHYAWGKEPEKVG
jgi:hypothetical protein